MSHPTRWRRLPAVAASAAMVAALLPLASAPAAAATATARQIDDGCPADRVPAAGFGDTAGTVFELEIDCVAWYGVTSGNSQGNYDFRSNVTRAAMAKFLINLINSSGRLLDPSPTDAFDDDDGTAFELEINQLAGLGIVGGSRDTEDFDRDGDTQELIYKPQALVSRAQMAKFIHETHKVLTGEAIVTADDFFTDDDGTFLEDDINAIASVGVATGVNETTYNIGGTVTRGAMAAFLAREIDLLVELGVLEPPVTGVADVLLDDDEINQGRQVTGRVVTEGDQPVSSMTVDICNGANGQDVTVNLDGFLFSFTMPFNATPGTCELDFTLEVGNQTELESKTITVVETEKILAGPELISIVIDTVGAETVTIRFEFDTEVNEAVEASKFRLYGFASDQFTALSAQRTGPGTVEAIFTRSQYDDATTGGLDRFAVQDLEGRNNAEYNFGLKDKQLVRGETSFPDLISVTGAGQQLTFTFDAPVHSVGPEDFAAVYVSDDDGAGPNPSQASTVTATSLDSGSEGSTVFTLSFPAPVNATVQRGVIKANSIASIAEGATANARQSEDIEGVSQGGAPHLQSVILDPANNQAQFVFSEAISNNTEAPSQTEPCMISLDAPGCEVTPGIGLALYDINGETFYSYDVEQGDQRTLIATYDAGIVTGVVQGGSADQGAALAQRNGVTQNGVDEFGRNNVFQEGRTAAPDLLSVSRTSDADGNLRLTYTFDQSAVISDGSGPFGDFSMYANDNTRFVIDIADCTADGVEVLCSFAPETDAFTFAQTARYAAAGYAAVNAGNETKYNPESGFRLG